MPVVTAHVVQKAMPVTVPAVGTVETIAGVQIRSQVTGQLTSVHFAEGQDVQKGQSLFSLDSRPFEAALRQAEAVLARDTATAKNTQAQQARAESLFERGLIARDQYETLRASASALEATLAADTAAVENARVSLQYTDIKAPMSGRTGSLAVHVGDLVRANDTAPLVTINQLSPVYVTFSVPGRYLGDIRRFQASKRLRVVARLPEGTLPGASGLPAAQQPVPATPPPGGARAGAADARDEGRVTFIDNAVDPTTGTIKMKGTFANAGKHLWPGSFVQVTLDLTTDPQALVVPVSAVQTSQDGQFVYTVKPDRTVEMRPVTVERQQGDEMVIARGLSAGEEVVTDGQLRLTPGAKITSRAQTGERGGGRTGSRGDAPRGPADGRGAARQ